MADSTRPTIRININRAPVMTLWAAVVAERLGYDRETALTLGKAVAGLNAVSKGRRLGLVDDPEAAPSRKRASPTPRRARETRVELLGRSVPAVRTPRGLRAVAKGSPVSPGGVDRYLVEKFGPALPAARAAMEALAAAYDPERLAGEAYALYERFRPDVPAGARGWGARGALDLARLRALAPGGDE